jgi:hypothetical protein
LKAFIITRTNRSYIRAATLTLITTLATKIATFTTKTTLFSLLELLRLLIKLLEESSPLVLSNFETSGGVLLVKLRFVIFLGFEILGYWSILSNLIPCLISFVI